MGGGGMMGMFDGRVWLVDGDGRLSPIPAAPTLCRKLDQRAIPLPIVVDGCQVGTLYFDGPIMEMPMADNTALLSGLTAPF